MSAEAERQMSAIIALYVETIWVEEFPFVAIGGPEQYEHRCIRWDSHATHIDRLSCAAKDNLNRRIIAQDFFNQLRNEGAVASNLCQNNWLRQQREYGVAEQVPRRFISREQDQHGHRENLVDAQRLAFLFRLHERRQ